MLGAALVVVWSSKWWLGGPVGALGAPPLWVGVLRYVRRFELLQNIPVTLYPITWEVNWGSYRHFQPAQQGGTTLKKRLISLISLVALTAGLFVGVSQSPAHADHFWTGGHISGSWWAGVNQNVNCRSVWVLDRTGNSTMNAGIKQFVDSYNNDAARRGVSCQVPLLSYSKDSGSVGACLRSYWTGYNGYNFITICKQSNSQGPGITYQAPLGHTQDRQPNIFLGEGYNQSGYLTFSGHELLHAIGWGGPCSPGNSGPHTCDTGSLLYYTVPAGRYMNEHDWSANINAHLGHGGPSA